MLSTTFPPQQGAGCCGQEACRPGHVLPREASHPCPDQEGVHSPRGGGPWELYQGPPDPPNVRQMSELERFWKVICTELLIWQMRKLWPEREGAGASKLVRGRTRFTTQLLRTLHPARLSMCSEGARETVRAAPWVCRAKLNLQLQGFRARRELSLPSRTSCLGRQFHNKRLLWGLQGYPPC